MNTDEIVNRLREYAKHCDGVHSCWNDTTLISAADLIESLQAQPENEPLVRCGECAKYQNPNCAAKHEQALMDFCSHAVRKEEGGEKSEANT